jgi:hypothetical protein
MKDDLMLKKFKKENVNGTFNLKDLTTFFNSKLIDIEDNILINDFGVQYFQLFETSENIEIINNLENKNNGYQYYNLDTNIETLFILDLVDLKYNNHSIIKTQQEEIDEINNTRWQININIKNILKEYLFAKIKEMRCFKVFSYENFQNNNINESIYKYIEYNLLDRYKFVKIDLFIKYININENTVYSNMTLKQYDPMYNSSIETNENKIKNISLVTNNFIDYLSDITINYYQTKPSSDYKFDYYFNVYYEKI